MAIISRRCAEPDIANSGNAINSEVYIKECLTRLKDFIDEYHSDGNYIFWPDLATAHYSNITQEVYESFGHFWVKDFMRRVGQLIQYLY